jgi:GNAT superfamily N-acetyltransferase
MRLEGGPADAIEVLDAPPVPGLTFRSYRGEEDLPLFKEVFDGCKEVDQIWWSMTIEEYVNEFRHLVGCDPERDIVVAEVDGRVVGYSKMRMYVERDGTVRYMHNAFVLPAFRGVGIRRAFLRHHHQRAC